MPDLELYEVTIEYTDLKEKEAWEQDLKRLRYGPPPPMPKPKSVSVRIATYPDYGAAPIHAVADTAVLRVIGDQSDEWQPVVKSIVHVGTVLCLTGS